MIGPEGGDRTRICFSLLLVCNHRESPVSTSWCHIRRMTSGSRRLLWKGKWSEFVADLERVSMLSVSAHRTRQIPALGLLMHHLLGGDCKENWSGGLENLRRYNGLLR